MNINLTLIAQVLTFALFLWFTARFVWPPLLRAMAERQKTIADGLAQAERARNELDIAHRRAADILREAREDAAQVIADAGKRASAMIEEAKNQSRAEGERLLAAARAEIALEASRAKEGLRTAIADLAVAGAARILEKEIDKATHARLLDDVVSKL
jgi:F-type H+-transporting ATPase subunit b